MTDFETDLPASLLTTVQDGVMRTRYRGRRFLKSPFDQVLYLQLFDESVPRTVIEIGTKDGGSALWFADMLGLHGVEQPRVVSVDIAEHPDFEDDRIEWVSGDARDLAGALHDVVGDLPRPWLVVEDSAHHYETSIAVLQWARRHLRSGDRIVIEDGVVRHLGEAFDVYEDGPCRAVADFLVEADHEFEVDRRLCDFYGHNVTYNPSSWLRRR